jgi:3-oxoacyl-[acyl-carrier protein] reductase
LFGKLNNSFREEYVDLGIKGKRALVMGSSYGMGNGIARGLAAEGVDIILTARHQDTLDKEAKDIADTFGVRVEAKACDLSKDGDLDALLDFVGSRPRSVAAMVRNYCSRVRQGDRCCT